MFAVGRFNMRFDKVVPLQLVCFLLVGLQRSVSVTPECTCVIQFQDGEIPCNETESGPDQRAEDYPEVGPGDLKLEAYRSRDAQGGDDIGITVTWVPPKHSTPSFRKTTGFRLSITHYPVSEELTYYLPFPSDLRVKGQPGLKWNFSCTSGFKNYNHGTVIARVSSLPQPTTNIPDPTTRTVDLVLNFANSPLADDYSWKPDITLHKDRTHRKLIAKIDVPPERRKTIPKFEVWTTKPEIPIRLYKLEEREDAFYFRVDVPKESVCTNYTVEFRKLCSDGCATKITDKYKCKRKAFNRCSEAAALTIMKEAALNDSCQSPTTAAPTTTTTTTTTVAPPAGLPENDTPIIPEDLVKPVGDDFRPTVTPARRLLPVTVAIPVTMVAVGAIFLGAYFFTRWRRKHPPVINPPADPENKSPSPSLTSEDGAHLIPGPRRRVLIINSNDHERHLECIQALATFLERHCHCDVIFDQWYRLEMQENPRLWHCKQRRLAEKIIIVQSEGASRLYHDDHEHHVTSPIVGPHVDSFKLSRAILRELAVPDSHPEIKKKLVMVRFSYTSVSHVIEDLYTGFQYTIPDHLEDLFFHLHDLRMRECGKIHSVPAVNANHYHQVAEGAALRDAIEAARRFQEENPDWCSAYPDMTTTTAYGCHKVPHYPVMIPPESISTYTMDWVGSLCPPDSASQAGTESRYGASTPPPGSPSPPAARQGTAELLVDDRISEDSQKIDSGYLSRCGRMTEQERDSLWYPEIPDKSRSCMVPPENDACSETLLPDAICKLSNLSTSLVPPETPSSTGSSLQEDHFEDNTCDHEKKQTPPILMVLPPEDENQGDYFSRRIDIECSSV